jgi:hypothetical protein
VWGPPCPRTLHRKPGMMHTKKPEEEVAVVVPRRRRERKDVVAEREREEEEELPPKEGDEGCRAWTCSRRRRRPPRAVSALPSPDATAREAGRGRPSAGRSRGQDPSLPPASRRWCRRWRPSEAEEARRAEEQRRE